MSHRAHCAVYDPVSGPCDCDGLYPERPPQVSVPAGWALVPIEPTLAMRGAYKNAMRDYISRLPAERRKSSNGKPIKLSADLKLNLRWAAMVKNAPPPPER